MNKKNKNERLNLYLDAGMFSQLKQRAKAEHLPLGTWVRQFICMNLDLTNPIVKSCNHYECK